MSDKIPEIQIHSCAKKNEKLIEVIDWINNVSAFRVTNKQVTANMPNIDAGELAFLSKENSDLKDELERTRKALEIARKALEEIKKHNKAMLSVLGEQIPKESTDTEEYCWWASCRIQDCLKALTQIEHKDK